MKLRKFWSVGRVPEALPLDPPLLLYLLVDLRGRVPRGPNFMHFLGIFGKILCCRPALGGLAPPPRGNPGSATDIPIRSNVLVLYIHAYHKDVLGLRW